jgi:hypothetical protein
MTQTELIKKQHYVPQFLLKKFSNPEGRVWVLDKATDKKFQVSSGDIGHQNYFYAIPKIEGLKLPTEITEAQRINAVEEYLRDIDSESGGTIDRILKAIEASRFVAADGRRRYYLSHNEKVKLSRFMIYQEMRTEGFREKLAQQYYLGYKAMAEMAIKIKHPQFKGKFDIQIAEWLEQLNHLKVIMDEKFVNLLTNICLDKVWVIGYNDTDLPFFCSDHPVVMHSLAKDHFLSGPAWASPKTEICVPLSPKVLLMLHCRSLYKLKPHLNTFAGYFEDKLTFLSRENVLHYNHLQYHYSGRRMFSCSDKFQYVQEFMVDHPTAKDPFRQRASVVAWGSELKLPEDWSIRHKRKSF